VSEQPTTRRLELGGFELAGTRVGTAFADLADAEPTWIPAVVPGGVHESLLLAGVIDHPYVDQNEHALRWIEDRDWWYRTSFDAPDGAGPDGVVRLVFHGLDTVADIWLNGEHLGHHENMFRPADFDITARVGRANELILRFSPPLAGLEPAAASVEQLRGVMSTLMPELVDTVDPNAIAPSPELTVASQRRKAMLSWGWDFGPRLPAVGIWRPAELVVVPRAEILSHHIRTDAVDRASGSADVTAVIETASAREIGRLDARVTLVSPSGRTNEWTVPIEEGTGRAALHLDQADLWWTHDIGDPSLYDLRIELRDSDGAICDVATDRVGIRTIEVDRTPSPEGGRLFRFVLNGVPLFARGANWLPSSMMAGSVSAERHEELIALARSGGMNMLRVWGGGIYEHDSFYSAADRSGVLIWQDFMFACADYPSEDPALQDEVKREAEYQVRRLRNRSSIALWSGNNEVQLLHGLAYQHYEPGDWGWDIFHRILPDAVHRLDPSATYWPGSPWGEDTPEGFMAVNGVLDGDRHAWEVWHGYDTGIGDPEEYPTVGDARHFRRYAKDTGRFISEFGIHSAPALSTLKRWIPSDRLAVHSASFDAHNKDHPKDKGDALLEVVTGLPTTLAEYVDFTMASQAEGMKFGIEHYRRRQPLCSGTLVWQFNDVWPGITWSLVDYDTVPKAAYYSAARAYSPVMASFAYDDGQLSLWVSNSGAHPVTTAAAVTIRGFDGTTHLEAQVPVQLSAGGSARVWSAAVPLSPERYAWVSSDDGLFPDNRLFFGEIKELPLPTATLRSEVVVTGDTSALVSVHTDAFAYLVRVTASHPTTRYDDNYFDLPPGATRTVRVSGLPHGFDPDDLMVGSFAGSRRR
jgi:beta-mannosidase